jgi:hypothetical protein
VHRQSHSPREPLPKQPPQTVSPWVRFLLHRNPRCEANQPGGAVFACPCYLFASIALACRRPSRRRFVRWNAIRSSLSTLVDFATSRPPKNLGLRRLLPKPRMLNCRRANRRAAPAGFDGRFSRTANRISEMRGRSARVAFRITVLSAPCTIVASSPRPSGGGCRKHVVCCGYYDREVHAQYFSAHRHQ